MFWFRNKNIIFRYTLLIKGLIQMVFLKEFLGKVYFEKKISRQQKNHKKVTQRAFSCVF